MRKMWFCALPVVLGFSICLVLAATLEGSGDKGMENSSTSISKDHIVTIENFYKKWNEVRDGRSKAIVLDVRTPKEYENGRVPGSKNIPSDHPSLILERWPDRDTEILVYCRTQRRATEVASFLYRHGYRNVYVLEGGILGWMKKGYPSE